MVSKQGKRLLNCLPPVPSDSHKVPLSTYSAETSLPQPERRGSIRTDHSEQLRSDQSNWAVGASFTRGGPSQGPGQGLL